MSSALWRAGCETPRIPWLLQIGRKYKDNEHKGSAGKLVSSDSGSQKGG